MNISHFPPRYSVTHTLAAAAIKVYTGGGGGQGRIQGGGAKGALSPSNALHTSQESGKRGKDIFTGFEKYRFLT